MTRTRMIAVAAACATLSSLAAGVPGRASGSATPAPTPIETASSPAIDGPLRADRQKPVDLLKRIERLRAVTSVRELPRQVPRGFRYFRISFTQPIDHHDPSLGTFQQRLSLLHRGLGRPTVMYTSGYHLSMYVFRSEPAAIVDGNQLNMEHRFFRPSRPSQPDWERELTIWQAAADEHKVVKAFQRIYERNWLTTGGSKGGMTATYHRRFYPDDVDGTIPYVAPNDVIDDDDVYGDFLAAVGTPSCRAKLIALQRRVLTDRDYYLDRLQRVSERLGYTYDVGGGMEAVFETGVIDFYFSFWQYWYADDCAVLPDPATATDNQVWRGIQMILPLTFYSDQLNRPYVPYYFQAAYQLGSPAPWEEQVADLLEFPGRDVGVSFVPEAIRPSTFDAEAMPDIDAWVRTESTRMLYVYGENDPWSAEHFVCGAGGAGRDCRRYVEPDGNHGSSIAGLPGAQRTAARQLVLAWAGLGPGDRAFDRVDDRRAPKRIASIDVRPDYLRRALP